MIKYFERKTNVPSIPLFLIGIFVSILLSCNQDNMNIILTHQQELKGIPSASGIVKVAGALYVIGDNAPYLYRLNHDYQVVETLAVIEGVTESFIPKISKPDFEAITSIGDGDVTELLIFGSGSKEPERNSMVRIHLKNDNSVKTYDLKALYDVIRTMTTINAATLNIEAAATVGDKLFIFNRETNMVLEYSLEAFLHFLDNNGALPKLKTYQLLLPQLQGLQAKVSGATAIPNTNQLLITASVENSPNTYDDGEVLGSYVGMISLDQLKDGYQPHCVLLEKDNQPLKAKVESLEIVQMINERHFQLVFVTDSDGGASELILADLTW